MADLRFRVPFSCILSGGSGTGKSYLLEQIVKEPDCFTEPITEICWVYSKHAKDEQLIERLANLNIDFREELPEEELLEATLFKSNGHKLLVLDDLFLAAPKKEILHQLFHIISRHQNISIFVTVHNLAAVTGSQRESLGSLFRSCKYIVLFVDKRAIPVVNQIIRSYFPFDNKRIFHHFMYLLKRNQPFQYMVFDFDIKEEKHQVRSGGILTDDCAYYYEDDAD